MFSRQDIAIGIAILAYSTLLAYWIWAGISYMDCVKSLPATKDRCNALAKIVLNKLILGAIATGPASAIFGLLKS
jgi:peptidoglycan biosynthesis protein MviN/MurJ (putative lipid II flippase)